MGFSRDLDHELTAYGSGDSQAFSRFFRQTKDGIYRYALSRLREPRLAEDATQEVYFKVHRAVLDFDPKEGSAASWLFTIARHVIIDMQRQNKRHRAGPLDLEVPSAASAPDERLLLEDLLESVRRSLSPEDFQILLERSWNELSHEALAEQTGLTPVNVRQRLSRMLKRLRESLERNV